MLMLLTYNWYVGRTGRSGGQAWISLFALGSECGREVFFLTKQRFCSSYTLSPTLSDMSHTYPTNPTPQTPTPNPNPQHPEPLGKWRQKANEAQILGISRLPLTLLHSLPHGSLSLSLLGGPAVPLKLPWHHYAVVPLPAPFPRPLQPCTFKAVPQFYIGEQVKQPHSFDLALMLCHSWASFWGISFSFVCWKLWGSWGQILITSSMPSSESKTSSLQAISSIDGLE